MQLYKTVDSNNLIRVEDNEGSAITVFTRGSYALILSITVPESDRGKGIGTALIKAVTRPLLSKGIKKIEADYPYTIEGFGSFLEKNGFSEIFSVPVLSIELKSLLSKPIVKRAILSEVEGANYVPLVELKSEQLEELFNSFSGMRRMITDRDVSRFFYDASGVVYDDSGRLEAFVLCSLDEDESSVHVDFLAGVGDGKPQYIMGAVKGMLTGLLENGGDRVYKNITLVAANPDINEMLDRVLKDDKATEVTGKVVFAIKELEETHDEAVAEDAPDEDMEDEWRREIRRVPLQTNIGLKMPWLRHRDDGTADEDEEYEEDIEETTEDESEGLEYPDTIRITSDNLERFRDHLDDVSVSDMSRYYYRGLAALTEEGHTQRYILSKLSKINQYRAIQQPTVTCRYRVGGSFFILTFSG